MPGITEIGKRTGLPTGQVRGVFEAVTALCQEGQIVSIDGFGSFRVQDRKATKGTNPKTGKPIDVPAQKVMRVKFSSTLRARLNPNLVKPVAPKVEKPAAEAKPVTANPVIANPPPAK